MYNNIYKWLQFKHFGVICLLKSNFHEGSAPTVLQIAITYYSNSVLTHKKCLVHSSSGMTSNLGRGESIEWWKMWVELVVHFWSCCYCASTLYEILKSVVTVIYQPNSPGVLFNSSLQECGF